MTTATVERMDLDALKRAHLLPALLAESGVELRRSGEGRSMGRCPFHPDQRPSLLVDERDQHFHCFSCGAHGDVISFVMRRDGIGFAEACARLGARPAPAQAGSPASPHRSPRERRWDRLTLEEQVVMNTAAALYHDALWREPRALAYLQRRGIPNHIMRSCGLGYADGHSLEAFLRRRSGLRVAQELGLLRKAERSDGARPLREFLAGRIVVPELRGGQIIWFIGRDLTEEQHSQRPRPKYLALGGERPVLGVERAAGHRQAFLCEGVFDFLTAVSWGLPAFSPCGTHLPAERLGFLARARVVYGVLDGDDAGRAAAARFGEQLGQRWRSLVLPDGCDLSDLAQRPGGRAEFFRLLAAARTTERRENPNGNHDSA